MQIDLSDIVSRYAAFGDHRTGSDADAATVDWLATLLTELGAEVTRHPFTFQRFEGAARLSGDLSDAALLPLWYAGRGALTTTALHVAALDLNEHLEPAAVDERLDAIVADARTDGAKAAVVATLCLTQSLCAINRAPEDATDFPVVLAPGHALDRLEQGDYALTWNAGVTDADACNITALFGEPGTGARTLVITTPISGWFRCAGERGTGLAVAIAAAAEIGTRHPVLLVLNTGHELGYLGGRRFHETFESPHGTVLHIGSCVADRQAYDGLEQQGVVSITNLEGGAFERAAAALAGLDITPTRPDRPHDPACWVGESEIWASGGKPMLSIAGTSRTFHTPADTAVACLDKRLLVAMTKAATDCAAALIESTSSPT